MWISTVAANPGCRDRPGRRLGLITGPADWSDALADGRVTGVGTRADVSALMPLTDIDY